MMNKIYFNQKGQGLVEYVILIAVIGVASILGLTIFGGSVEGGLLKVCASLGNAECQAAQQEAVPTPTLVIEVTSTPSSVPTVTPTLAEPDPTRQPESDTPTSGGGAQNDDDTAELISMRIKVVVKAGGKNSQEGIQVIIYKASGEYVTKGNTDSKGNVSFSLPPGDYVVATLYNGVWQKDTIALKNSKENVIHR